MPNQIYTQEIAQCKSTLSLVTLSFNLFTVFVYLWLKEIHLLQFPLPQQPDFTFACSCMHFYVLYFLLSHVILWHFPLKDAVIFMTHLMEMKTSSVFDQMLLTKVSHTVFISISSCLHSRAFHTVLDSVLLSLWTPLLTPGKGTSHTCNLEKWGYETEQG